MGRTAFVAWLCFFTVLGGSNSRADEPVDILARIRSWDRLHGDVRRNIRKYGPENIVVAVDFDNTTARVPTFYGSDAWYKAQLATGKDKEQIHRELDEIFGSTPHLLIDKLAPEYLRKWQDLRVRVVLLTARSPRFHDVTRREALRLSLDFSKSAPKSDWDGKDVLLAAKDKAGKPFQGNVAYRNGMVHCGDVDKGTVLRAFLEAADLTPAAVVMADDRLYHLEEVGVAFRGSPIDLRLILVDDGLEPLTCPAEVVKATAL